MRVIGVLSLLLGVVLGGVGCGPEPIGETGGPEASEAEESQSALCAQKLRYRQVDITAGPANLDGWAPFGISDRDEVFGQGFTCNEQGVCVLPLIKREPNGRFVTLAPNFQGNDVNRHGDVGGCVIEDPVTLNGQAAIVRANGRIELIPRLSGEISSCVLRLSDNRIAAVTSVDAASVQTVYVLDRHRIVPFTFPLAAVEDVNDRAELTGIISNPGANRAFRFDSRTQTTTILQPVPPDPHSWGLALNNQGDVLGYSFAFDGIERIGHWNRRNTFEVSFVEGTPEFPTVSNRLVWNEPGLIIISFSLNDPNTYLVPAPGVRLALADLVVNGPVATTLLVFQVNNDGDFVGSSLDDGRSFLFLQK